MKKLKLFTVLLLSSVSFAQATFAQTSNDTDKVLTSSSKRRSENGGAYFGVDLGMAYATFTNSMKEKMRMAAEISGISFALGLNAGYDWKVIKRSSDKRLLRDIVKGVIVRQSSIDHFIVMLNIKDWDKVDRVFACILRSAIYEILYRLKTPKIVAISEYTRVADWFFGKTHAKFINALLDRIVRTLRCREDECEIDFKSFHSLVENDNIT